VTKNQEGSNHSHTMGDTTPYRDRIHWYERVGVSHPARRFPSSFATWYSFLIN